MIISIKFRRERGASFPKQTLVCVKFCRLVSAWIPTGSGACMGPRAAKPVRIYSLNAFKRIRSLASLAGKGRLPAHCAGLLPVLLSSSSLLHLRQLVIRRSLGGFGCSRSWSWSLSRSCCRCRCGCLLRSSSRSGLHWDRLDRSTVGRVCWLRSLFLLLRLLHRFLNLFDDRSTLLLICLILLFKSLESLLLVLLFLLNNLLCFLLGFSLDKSLNLRAIWVLLEPDFWIELLVPLLGLDLSCLLLALELCDFVFEGGGLSVLAQLLNLLVLVLLLLLVEQVGCLCDRGCTVPLLL